MKHAIILLFSMGTVPVLFAQQPIDQLITAEKNFAAASAGYPAKKAFLSFADTGLCGI